MSIVVVSIPVADQSAAKSFYTDMLRFTVLDDVAMGPGMRWLQLQPPGGGASVALVTWFEAMPPGGQQGLMLHVPDIDAERERLAGLGLAIGAVEEQPWGRFAMFQDPDGNGWIVATVTEPETFRTR